jgi:molybdate transport system substrate-binding protein
MQTGRETARLIVPAAGSLRNAFVDVVSEFERRSGIEVRLEHGPAGLLREKIEQGGPFDVFASANMDHPEGLAALGLAGPVLCFAQNSLCVIARRRLGIREENLIDILADPTVKIGTSTPKADPSGDYAVEFFANVERQYPDKGKMLGDKARALVGGRDSAPIPPGSTPAGHLIGNGTVDVFVSYATNGLLCKDDPNLVVVPIPSYLGPIARYGVAPRPNAAGAAMLFRNNLYTPNSKLALTRSGYR